MTGSRGSDESPGREGAPEPAGHGRGRPGRAVRVGGETIAPGESRRLSLSLAGLPTRDKMDVPIAVVNGARSGPRLWLSAAVHGDELNGIEIIRRVLARLEGRRLAGTVIAAPIVNVFGFIHKSRYLPDRRDLNRSFPGSSTGSLAAQLAHLFMTEIVQGSTHGIDLHTGSQDRDNLPQVRADLSCPETRAFALDFGAPVTMDARTRDGSLREAAARSGVRVLLYEAGSPRRYQERPIRRGVEGVLSALAGLGMTRPHKRLADTVEASSSTWVRARRAGIFRTSVKLGDRVRTRQSLGVIAGPLGEDQHELRAPGPGMVIGIARDPLVYMGDAIVHLARLDGSARASPAGPDAEPDS